jgi:hypothetical protein
MNMRTDYDRAMKTLGEKVGFNVDSKSPGENYDPRANIVSHHLIDVMFAGQEAAERALSGEGIQDSDGLTQDLRMYTENDRVRALAKVGVYSSRENQDIDPSPDQVLNAAHYMFLKGVQLGTISAVA